MKAKKFEQAFDDGVDITASLDLSKAKRALLTPDCGFAAFADNPLNSDATAEARMAALDSATHMPSTSPQATPSLAGALASHRVSADAAIPTDQKPKKPIV